MNTFIIICVIILAFILLFFIWSDIKNTVKYIKSNKSDGYIIEILDIEKIASYGRHQYRNFRRYKVRYNENIESEILLRNTKLKIGDIVRVHYIVDNNGSFKILDKISYMRLSELIFSVIIALIIAKIGISMDN